MGQYIQGSYPFPTGVYDDDYGIEYYVGYYDGSTILGLTEINFSNGDNGLTLPSVGLYCFEVIWNGDTDYLVYSAISHTQMDIVKDSVIIRKAIKFSTPFVSSGVSFEYGYDVYPNGLMSMRNYLINFGVLPAYSNFSIDTVSDGIVNILREFQKIAYPTELAVFPPLIVDLSAVNSKLDDIESKVNSFDSSFISVESKIDNIDIDLSPLETSISNLQGFDFSGSLNGSGGTFKDGDSVSIEEHDGEFIVDSSNIMKYDENLHIVIYRCKKDDKYFNVPSNMVSLSVAPESP